MDPVIYSTAISVKPKIEPVDLGEVKDYLDIERDDNDEDTLLKGFIKAARGKVEGYTLRKLITQTLITYASDWPAEDYIELRDGVPLVSVTHVKYTNSAGNQSTFVDTSYSVDVVTEPGRIVLGYNVSWPSGTLRPDRPIEIEYVCGYGNKIVKVPDDLRTAMFMIIEDMFEERGAQKAIPGAAKDILDEFRLYYI